MKRPALITEAGRFIVVGLLSTILNYSVFYALVIAGISYLIASAAGFVIGVAIGYGMNKRWTFGVKQPSDRRHVLGYWMVYLTSLVCGLLLIRFLVEVLRVDVRLANLAAIVLTTCTNFAGTRFLVFKR